MVVKEDQIFNLMDMNDRRGDVLNALHIYLEILEEIKIEHPTEKWNSYPDSIAQFVFYEKVLEKSEDIFKVHKKYDEFINELGTDYQRFLNKNDDWIKNKLPLMGGALDEAIEQRSRHYTSNLVKMGFADLNRNITESGYAFLRGALSRDTIEDLLPLDDVNVALIRQLMKLRIFGNPDDDGNRQFYSPLFMALNLLLKDKTIEDHSFKIIVQGLNPYSDDNLKYVVMNDTIDIDVIEVSIQNIEIVLPEELGGKTDIDFAVFRKYFKSSKDSESIAGKYYKFFNTLKKFRNNRNTENYNSLIDCLESDRAALNKAFGYGKGIFNIGDRGKRYDLDIFLGKNQNHNLLNADDYMYEFYATFARSKWIDGIREYSDTTMRLLSATGLFKFDKLPDLSYKDVLSLIFDKKTIQSNIFGTMTAEEYTKYEDKHDCFFGKNTSLVEILNYSKSDVETIIEQIETYLKVQNVNDVMLLLQDKKNRDFADHIEKKYPKKKIMDLLPLFSDRRNDSKIKSEVNDAATVPTIYEYVIGIAWYYISNKNFDLYKSLNLTLNADFDPVLHAGGGDGDIVIQYNDVAVMLEVTLMNKQAQKRGEWGPVLRHSLNLKAANEEKETITFFIADELDYNTVNIWRAVAAASLESTNTHQVVEGVIIMPFTNVNILDFLKNNVNDTQIISEVKTPFANVPKISDTSWHGEVVQKLLA